MPDLRGRAAVVDLVLSSGFLAFARQTGFLTAVEEVGLGVDGICGTSSGALAGALWAAGMPAARIGELLYAKVPVRRVRPHLAPWRGAFSLAPVITELRRWLPARIEDLDRPFGVGVMDAARRPHLLTEGPLAEAVAASCAIPWVFAPVDVGGTAWADGGLVDRTFLGAWRSRRPDAAVLLHLVDSSRGDGVVPDAPGVTVVRSGVSGASFFSLGDFAGQAAQTRQRTLDALTAGRSAAASPA